ncbi:MAG TPA: TrmH family RNA methyltransferase [Candidatus Nitrosocosmicus sp.]|nr:TrmH family RNA methyltransferase [Candidatus Nitrosocosmicus sp.]
MKLNAKELRDLELDHVDISHIKRIPVYLIIDNVYDTYNIGGLFRLSDALALEKIMLCGSSETPPNPKIKKASIGTYKIVPWEYYETTKQAIEQLRSSIPDIKIYAVEQSKDSVPYTNVSYEYPFALIVGNETSGVDQEVLKLVDQTVEIPMFGINKSLNVIVSAAIVAYNSILRTSPANTISETPADE